MSGNEPQQECARNTTVLAKASIDNYLYALADFTAATTLSVSAQSLSDTIGFTYPAGNCLSRWWMLGGELIASVTLA
jgi:hypothetical protein